MKITVWAVYTDEIDVTGRREKSVEVRLQKTPRLMIPYEAKQLANFAEVAPYLAKSKYKDGFTVRYAKQYNRWNDKTKLFEYGEVIEVKSPEAFGRRGYHVCEECGGKTRSVLDGEAWCSTCQRYQ